MASGRHYTLVSPMRAVLLAVTFGFTGTGLCAETPATGFPGSAAEPVARWVVDPSRPGPDLPTRGRSLFDHLLADLAADGETNRIPFPFTALRERLHLRLRSAAQGRSPTRAVLIPLGRSLQRTAAAPDFFRFPRVVLAVDGEADPPPGSPGLHLKDRLYLGYIEQPGILEVISYNEEAGRFEFQIVKDYRAGGNPEVVYANRAVCIACHQNGTPIFSRPLWGETNSDPGIADRLRAEQREYYGIPITSGVDLPGAIDAATDRANRIPLVQLLWGEGCGHAGDLARARQCRATALHFALRFRLTGSTAFIDAGNANWQAFSDLVESATRRGWPHGLLVSSPDIPNRIPLTRESPGAVSGARHLEFNHQDRQDPLTRQMHIPAEFEPLQPRPPLEVLQPAVAARHLVTGLAGFLAEVDMERLDLGLFRLAAARGAYGRYSSECQLSPRKRGDGHYRVSVRCIAPGEPGSTGFRLSGRIYLREEQVVRGAVGTIEVNGFADTQGLQVREGTVESSAHGRHLRLILSRHALSARLPDGNAVGELVIDWPWPAGQLSKQHPVAAQQVAASLRVLEDFPLLGQAFGSLLTTSVADDDLLSAAPFRRRLLLQTLFPLLGVSLPGCCPEHIDLPPAKSDAASRHELPGKTPTVAAGIPESGFYQYCSRCHQTSERFPPNFLYGDRARVQASLAHCAERLYLRLKMWSVPAGERIKTPMPPVYALPMLGLEETSWQDSGDLASLLGYVNANLQQQTGNPPRVEALVQRGYENLRPCLPGEHLAGGLDSVDKTLQGQ